MTTPLWARIPAEVRAHIDELLAQHRKLQAIAVIRDHVDNPRPGLLECQALLAKRCAELGYSLVRLSPPLDLDTLTDAVAALPMPPDAIEALWDGDSDGWFVCLVAVTAQPRAEHHLAVVRHGTDIRLFDGEVPPWPEAREAADVGSALADRRGVPFHFVSPEAPHQDPPRWWNSVA
ncbi:hypothetical protein ACFXK0_07095 [Nocardia sp. NPDC059177]|uniref:hypothetical protein n=1 Tax=Nocardia sp. NPDC059177 TaxID=3346759 RepID=UPI0036B102D1